MSFLRPPGALPESAFLKTCIHCGQCAAACPYGSVRMLETFGPERHTPEIRPSEIPCWLCMKCPPACPSGALRPVAAMKEANMGKAVIFKDRCLNWIESGTMCMTCYHRCPLRGEGMVLDMGYVPAVGESCVGCGMCEYVCPKNAVAVVPDVQKKGGKA